MPIRSFSDTSAVSLAYAIDAAADASELTATKFNYVPFTQEGFQLSKEAQMSTAIRGNRRPSGSKNTSGTASGSAGLEFGLTPFIDDMLEASMMSEWKPLMEDDGSGSPVESTNDTYLIDSDLKKYVVFEKRIKNTIDGVKKNFFERYFGSLINETSIEIGGSDLVTMSVNTMSVFGDLESADADSDEDAGGMATEYLAPEDYEIADASNNVKKATLKDDQGTELEVVFSDLSISITNNVREQSAVGSEFAAGMGMGKVAVQVSGTIYYYDDSVLKAHLANGSLNAEITIETKEGSYVMILPKAKAEAPNANAGGENQDYTQSLTLNGEEGEAEVGAETLKCVMAIIRKPAQT